MGNFYDFLERFNELALLLKGSKEQHLALAATVCPFDATDAFGHRLAGDFEKRHGIVFERQNGEREIVVISSNGMVPRTLCQIFAGEDGVTFVSARAYQERGTDNQHNYGSMQYNAGEMSEKHSQQLEALTEFHSSLYAPARG